ncbi:MAG: hypothetical protein HY906_07015 [Deltaproteobacteria bacterium]|nr:hypothetical protein [Deltaproteobacteria bacterium]
MKISGSGPLPPPPDETPATKPGKAEGAAEAFSRHLEGTTGPEGAAALEARGPEGAARADAAAAADPVRSVAADLRAGRITPEQAVDRLVEDTVSRRIGAQAPEAVRARLRASLVDLLARDPHLADLVKRLERAR